MSRAHQRRISEVPVNDFRLLKGKALLILNVCSLSDNAIRGSRIGRPEREGLERRVKRDRQRDSSPFPGRAMNLY